METSKPSTQSEGIVGHAEEAGSMPDLPDGAAYYRVEGHRRLAVEMLIHSVYVVKTQPESKEAARERSWLLGVESDAPFDSSWCFETVVGSAIDVASVSKKFVSALDQDPEHLLHALRSAKTRMVDGNLFGDMGDTEYSVIERDPRRSHAAQY